MRKLSAWILLLTAALPAQAEWHSIDDLRPGEGRLVYDTVGGRLLAMVSMNRILALANDGWRRVPVTGVPASEPINNLRLTWDPRRGVLVAYWSDALNSPYPSSLWEWDGLRWSQSTVPGFPGTFETSAFALTWDPSRAAVVLVGRLRGTRTMETWTYDGTAWTSRPSPGLPLLRGFVVAPDAAGPQVVLFGGSTGTGSSDDTWLWDGARWTRAAPTHRPPASAAWSFAHDPIGARTVLVGTRSSPPGAEAWAWDGSDWTSIVAPPHTTSQSTSLGPKLAFDPARGELVHLAYDTTLRAWDGSGWATVLDAVHPVLDGQADLAWDPVRGSVVTLAPNGLWDWEGARWRAVPSATIPTPRTQYRMVTDSARGRIVMFGGVGIGQIATGTWEWDGLDWTRVATAHEPPVRYRHAMAYDAARAVVVLFGGMTSNGKLDDTWTYDGVDWTVQTPSVAPPARMEHGMAYDARLDRIVLFGGLATSGWGRDTWEWDGATWSQRAPTPVDGGRSLAYHPIRQRVVLHGVENGGSVTREWNGTAWVDFQVTAESWANASRPMAFDAARERMVTQFDAEPMVWELITSADARFEAFGQGCAGSAGTPSLAASSGSRPLIGATFAAEVDALPGAATVFGILGLSDRWFGALPLPLDLATIGMPTCALRVSMDDVRPLPGAASPRSWVLAIPGEPSLTGRPLFLQAFVLDPGVNPLGATVSNGGAAWFGIR